MLFEFSVARLPIVGTGNSIDEHGKVPKHLCSQMELPQVVCKTAFS